MSRDFLSYDDANLLLLKDTSEISPYVSFVGI